VFATYIIFFPKLLAGPVEPPEHFFPQMHRAKHISRESAGKALHLLVFGWFKKLVVADHLHLIVQDGFQRPETYGSFGLCFILLMALFQIYADFSGYTDLARGASLLFGIDLVENFKQPFFQPSVRDFWRSWHISMTSWFQHYVYIPLGGNRCSSSRRAMNVLVVTSLIGLWHDLSWPFFFWGLYIGLLILGSRRERPEGASPARRTVSAMIVVALVAFSTVFFNAPGVEGSLRMLKALFTGPLLSADAPWSFPLIAYAIVLAASILVIDGLQAARHREDPFAQSHWIVQGLVLFGFMVTIILLRVEVFSEFVYATF
jgi:D-alanyl-lipoteichoic acid acyltransferase DltB (MBOAT superfamily)